VNEIIFLVENDPEGGYVAQAIGQSIFTQADSIEALKMMVSITARSKQLLEIAKTGVERAIEEDEERAIM
jgi:hypothetical protein